MPQKQTVLFSEVCVFTYATETDQNSSRSICWNTTKIDQPFSGVYVAIRHRNRASEPQNFFVEPSCQCCCYCTSTYPLDIWNTTKIDQPFSGVYVAIHHRNRASEPQNFFVEPSCQCCCYCTSTYPLNIISFTNLCDICCISSIRPVLFPTKK